jgi:hypothetical protein
MMIYYPLHQYSYKNLFGTCARLCKIVQPSQDQKLQVSQAMSKFWQVVASKSFQSLPSLLHTICIIQTSFIYFLNMPWEPEQLSVCWCCRHRHQQCSRLFFISITLGSIKICVGLWFYSICALDWLESHKSNMGGCRSSQSQDLWWGELVETCRQPEKPLKGPKGQKVFCSFADVGCHPPTI